MMIDKSTRDYVKQCFETAIMVDKVMPSPKPRSKYNLLSDYEAMMYTIEDNKIIVTKEDLKIYEMVCFSWVYAFNSSNRYLFNALWKFYTKMGRKRLAQKLGISRPTLYRWVDEGIHLIETYLIKEHRLNG